MYLLKAAIETPKMLNHFPSLDTPDLLHVSKLSEHIFDQRDQKCHELYL